MSEQPYKTGDPLTAKDLDDEVARHLWHRGLSVALTMRARKGRCCGRESGRWRDGWRTSPMLATISPMTFAMNSVIVVRVAETMAQRLSCIPQCLRAPGTPAGFGARWRHIGVRGKKRSDLSAAFTAGLMIWTARTAISSTTDDWHGALNPGMTCLSTSVRSISGAGSSISISARKSAKRWPASWGRGGASLSHFEFDKMRYKWRQWCDLSVQLENRDRGVSWSPITPPRRTINCWPMPNFMPIRNNMACIRFRVLTSARPVQRRPTQGGGVAGAGKGDDPRVSTYELARENYTTINYAASTDTLIECRERG